MQREKDGRFAVGNTVGTGNANSPGRPPRAKEERYLKTLRAVVTIKRWRAIAERAVSDAEDGDKDARTWLSNYLLGKPLQRIEADVEVTGAMTLEMWREQAAERRKAAEQC